MSQQGENNPEHPEGYVEKEQVATSDHVGNETHRVRERVEGKNINTKTTSSHRILISGYMHIANIRLPRNTRLGIALVPLCMRYEWIDTEP